MGKYFSTASGRDLDYIIHALQNMHPQIIVTGAVSDVTLYSTKLPNPISKTPVSGICAFDIPEYGDYYINDANMTDSDYLVQVYAFKQYEFSLSPSL